MNWKRVTHSQQKSENGNKSMKMTNSDIPVIMNHEDINLFHLCQTSIFLSKNSKNDDKSAFLEIMQKKTT